MKGRATLWPPALVASWWHGPGASPDTATSLHPSLGVARVWYCNLPDGRTAFTNGLIHGITDGRSASGWGVPVPQLFGASTQVAGKLPRGEYRYALTYTRLADGLEGGAVYSAPLTLEDGGLLLLGCRSWMATRSTCI